MSVGDVKATVGQGVLRVAEARRAFVAASVELGEVSQFARQTVQDSRHPEVGKALTCLREAEREIGLTIRRLEASAKAADEYLTALG